MPAKIKLLPPPRRGRPFEAGNPGRRPGSRNKTTVVAQALLHEEGAELIRKAVELAKAGDTVMLKFLLDRILPKGRALPVELPEISNSADAEHALLNVLEGVRTGQISTSEAAAIAGLIADYVRAFDNANLEARLQAVEERMKSEVQ